MTESNTTSKRVNELCRAGAKHGGHDNYDKYHVTGAVYGEFGEIDIAKNCVFCGRDCSEDFRGGIYEEVLGDV